MNDKKKKFIIPEADIVDFANADIITLSAATQQAIDGDGLWGNDDNTEGWKA